MKTSEFKKFTQYIKECDDNDPIWWQGWIFINLTARQAERTTEICIKRFGTKEDAQGKTVTLIPSGIGFFVKHR